jgi:hypothetical protein
VRPRGVLLLAAALYLLATVIWVGSERRSPRQFLSAGSALNDGERGTSLAREYLQERPGHPAARLLERPVSAAELPASAVVFRLEPEALPWRPWRREAPPPKPSKPERSKRAKTSQGKKSQAEEGDEDDADDEEKAAAVHPGRFVPLLTADEEEWVEGGGRLVLGIAGSYGPVWADREPGQAPLAKVFPLWPEVRTLRLLDRRVLRGPALGRAHAVILAGEAPVIARLPLGRGDVVLLSCPDVFHNARLAVGDHLALLAALAEPGRPVYFDERTHGIQADAGLLDVLARWGLGPALLLAGLAVLAAAAREKVRVGPAERDPPDRRSEAVDLVDSLGELYDRSLTRGDAIRLYWEGFVHAVGVDTGLAGASLTARAEELAAGFLPPASGENLSREGFERALRALNSARRRARDGKYDRPRRDA